MLFLWSTQRRLTVRRGTSGVWWCKTSYWAPLWSGPVCYLKPLSRVWLWAPARASLRDHWPRPAWRSATTNKTHTHLCTTSPQICPFCTFTNHHMHLCELIGYVFCRMITHYCVSIRCHCDFHITETEAMHFRETSNTTTLYLIWVKSDMQ